MTQVELFFSEMENYIAESRKVVAQSRELDMRGLDEKIEALCNMILELDKDGQAQYEDRLRNLLGNLNELGNEMRAQVEGIKDIPQHRAASVAYKTADSRDNFGHRPKTDEDKE